MSWASKKQFKYLSIFVLVLVIIIFALTYNLIFKKPSCMDGKQNNTETGVDCGGTCSLMCQADVSAPVILWSRAFPVVENNYNLVAYIENRNKNSGVVSASYEFRVYDTNNKLLGRVEGKTFIPPNQQFVVFAPRFNSGENKIKSVSFEFTNQLVWIKKEPTLQTLPVRVSNVIFDNNKDTPRLSAIISNDSIYDIPEFDVVTILYDADHNAINASKTHKSEILNGTNFPVVFTWPEAFSIPPVTEDVLIQIDPFSVSF